MRICALSIGIVMLRSVSAFVPGPEEQRGILKYSIVEHGEHFGEAGQTVRYWRHGEHLLDVSIDGKVLKNVPAPSILPYDGEVAVSWAYVSLNQPYFGYNCEERKDRFFLAKNILKTFPENHLKKQLLAMKCKEAKEYETCMDGKSFDEAISCFEEYLGKYKDQEDRPELQWKLAQLKTEPYEYESHVESILTVAKTYEQYLSRHLHLSISDQIKLTIAKRYRMAYESLVYDQQEYNRGFTKDDARKFLQRAISIYQDVLRTGRLPAQEMARLALYNISHNKRTYVSSNEW